VGRPPIHIPGYATEPTYILLRKSDLVWLYCVSAVSAVPSDYFSESSVSPIYDYGDSFTQVRRTVSPTDRVSK